jgi:hypothetical protein
LFDQKHFPGLVIKAYSAIECGQLFERLWRISDTVETEPRKPLYQWQASAEVLARSDAYFLHLSISFIVPPDKGDKRVVTESVDAYVRWPSVRIITRYRDSRIPEVNYADNGLPRR